MDNDTYNDRIPKMNDQMNMKFIKLEDQLSALSEAFDDYKHEMELKLERIDDILVVHRNQNDTQRKNYASLIKVWDEKVLPLIEGTHGK
mgnify:CR=1 FL=1|tara:strand:- start:516 stop:782 length:267 start_codon:yes stop_codon:yes gene_type:complete